jgi:hypothetical protein
VKTCEHGLETTLISWEGWTKSGVEQVDRLPLTDCSWERKITGLFLTFCSYITSAEAKFIKPFLQVHYVQVSGKYGSPKTLWREKKGNNQKYT